MFRKVAQGFTNAATKPGCLGPFQRSLPQQESALPNAYESNDRNVAGLSYKKDTTKVQQLETFPTQYIGASKFLFGRIPAGGSSGIVKLFPEGNVQFKKLGDIARLDPALCHSESQPVGFGASQQTVKNILAEGKKSDILSGIWGLMQNPIGHSFREGEMHANTNKQHIENLQEEQLQGKNKLKSQITELNGQVAKLTEEKDQLDKDLNSAKQSLNEKDKELENTKSQLEKLKQDLNEKTEEFEDKQAQLTEKEGEVNKLNGQVAQLTGEKKQLEEKLNGAQQSLDEKDKELEDTKSQLEKLKQDLSEKTEEFKDKQAQLTEKEGEVNKLNDQVTKLTEEKNQLDKDLNSTRQSLNEKDKELENIKTQFAEKERELNSANQRALQLEQGQGTVQQQLKALEDENNNLKIKLRESESKIQELESRVKELEALKSANESKIQDLQEQLESKNKELEDDKNSKPPAVNVQGVKSKVNYASAPFILSGVCAVGASLATPYLAICAILAVAASVFFALGCYCLYKANTTLSNVEVDQQDNQQLLESSL